MRVAWIFLIAGCGFQARAPLDEEAAPLPDAGFDVATCPAGYDVALPGPGPSSSRYRLITEVHSAWTQSDACAADLRGATHLVVLESQDELDRVVSLVAATTTPVNAIWVGAVQQPTAMQPTAGWLWFDGSAVTGGWGGVEPNDRDKQENQEEQFARIEKTKLYLQDSGGGGNSGALCECDGKPIAPAAATAIAAYRPAS